MRWISFAQADSLSRSLVHLFPTSKGGFSAQSVYCSVELFADRPEPLVIALDGMQLNQPDGVRLEELFPRLKEGGNSLVGVAVTLETQSGKGDLSASRCSIEILNRVGSVHFPMILDHPKVAQLPTIAVVTDRTVLTSLVIINQGQRYAELQLKGREAAKAVGEPLQYKTHSLSVAPSSVNEFSLSNQNSFLSEVFHSAQGELALGAQELIGELGEGIAAFAVYRDGVSKSISSVLPL